MKRLSWAQVIVINATLLTFAAYVVIQGSLKAVTRTTSSAALPSLSPTPLPFFPTEPPILSKVEYWYGKPGDQVRLRGQHFGANRFTSALFIGDLLVPADQIITWTDQIIDFTVPKGAVSGPVTLVINQRQAVGPILSVYQDPANPRLQFVPTSEGYSLNLINAPAIPLTLTVNGKAYSLKPQSPTTLVAVFPQKINLETASLADLTGNLLPLYQNPLD